MKLIVRVANADGLALPGKQATRAKVLIEHYWRDEEHELAVNIGADGSAVAALDLPPNAVLGHYRVEVEIDGRRRWARSAFRVEQFRVGAMRASIAGPTGPVVNTGSVPVTLSVEHLAGGGAASLPVTVRSAVREWTYYWEDGPPPEPSTVAARLDPDGKAHLVLPVAPLKRKGALDVEMDYQDANGQRKTATQRFELWPAAVDLSVESDTSDRAERRILVKVRRIDGTEAPGVPVEAKIYYPRYHEYQRLPGGFRANIPRPESKLLATCTGETDATGTLACDVPARAPNRVFVEATGWDADGKAARTMAHTGYWDYERPIGWLEADSERLFQAGETVPIRMDIPVPEATVLLTVYREGVLDAFVKRVKGPQAVVEVPVRRSYAPNVEVSVLAVPFGTSREPGHGPPGQPQLRLRGETPAPLGPDYQRRDREAQDFRLGTVNVRIGLEANALSVTVAPERETYRTGDRVRVRIAVAGPDGRPQPHAEVALVAVDEGLLDLWPNETWDILELMMAERYARGDTSTSLGLLNRSFDLRFDDLEEVIVTGNYLRRSGFGGNAEDEQLRLRERFDSLLLWRARLAMDAQGTAEIEVPLNDLLSSFRIVAVATAGPDLFGTGEATIRTTQDVILHSGLPEIVRQGDRFDAAFSVRNASDRTQRLRVSAKVAGVGELRRKRLTLRPGRTREVSWPVTVPLGVDELAWEVTARGKAAGDRMVARQSVEPVVPVRVQQATLTQLGAPRELPVKSPDSAIPGRGGIRVALQPSLVDNLGSMREAMSRYRYACLEQKVSVAVALADEERWTAAMQTARTSLDDDGLLRFFPSERLRGSPVLTAYVLAIADAAGRDVPGEIRDEMIKGLSDFVRGRLERPGVLRVADSRLRRLTALSALARHDALNVRLLGALDEPDPETLPTSALLDWIDTLARVDGRAEQLARAKSALRTRLTLQGTSMGFSTEPTDRLWWLMVSTDANAARAILAVLGDPGWRADLPRMMRGLFGRQKLGRWQTTVANAWGTVAAAGFATSFEPAPVAGTSLVGLGEELRRVPWSGPEEAAPDGGAPAPVDIPWSAARTLSLAHDGTGAPWSLVELRAAVPLAEPVARGYRIARRVEPVDQAEPDAWRRGDVGQIVLDVDSSADMTWVVVEDPLPPGAVVLGSGLGGDSSLLAADHEPGDRWPVFTERDIDRYRAYYRYLPRGRTTLRYNVRYNTAGRFQLPPTRVEAMYAPEMHAERPVKPVVIR